MQFITLLGGVAGWPLAAHTQPTRKVYRIGFLGAFSQAEYGRHVDALRMGLRQRGYEEGKNIVTEYR